jgi:aspartyl-tRNA(Asn)/glutamyl-tRNA(Gln) amidotransferase subunit B
VEDRMQAGYFEEAVSELESDLQEKAGQDLAGQAKIQLLFNYLNSDLKGLIKERQLDFTSLRLTPENFADLIDMISKNEISSRTAKDLLAKMAESGVDPRTLVENEGLQQISGEFELGEIVKKVISENPKAVEDYKSGKATAIQFLVGKAMAALRGRGNPEMLRNLFEKELK